MDDKRPGVAETVVNAFVDPMIMVVNDILDGAAAAARAVQLALAGTTPAERARVAAIAEQIRKGTAEDHG